MGIDRGKNQRKERYGSDRSRPRQWRRSRMVAHIGIIDALTEAGIEPEIVCGTSMGALVGAAYVAGRLADLRQWAEAASWREIVPLMDVRFAGGGLIDAKQVIEFLRGIGIGGPIESYAKTYAAVATDFVTGREIWLQSGLILEAVRASIALPGFISPANVDGRWLLDGGLVNPVPVSVCRALGADVIIAVNLNGDLLGRRFEKSSWRLDGFSRSVRPERVLRADVEPAPHCRARTGHADSFAAPATRAVNAGLFRRPQ